MRREVSQSIKRIDTIDDRVSKLLSACGVVRVLDADLFGTRGMLVEESYEAKQHTARYGRAAEPVCRALCTIVGALASSLARTNYFVVEDRCVAKGDEACRLFAHTNDQPNDETIEPTQTLAEIERAHILASLERNAGNQARTAKQLGIGSATLYRKLKSYQSKSKTSKR